VNPIRMARAAALILTILEVGNLNTPIQKGCATIDVPPKSWTFNKTLIIQLSIVVSSVLYRAHSF
jgi:hypothetical protein